MEKSALSAVRTAGDKLNALNLALTAQSPENRLRLNEEKLISLEKRSKTAFEGFCTRLDSELAEKIARLDSLSPLKVLARGYSLVYSGDTLISSSDNLESGDEVKIRLGSGGFNAEVIEKW